MESIESLVFEMNMDDVPTRSPRRIGEYVAGMAGTKTKLSESLALICSVKQYNQAEIAEAGAAFDNACLRYRVPA